MNLGHLKNTRRLATSTGIEVSGRHYVPLLLAVLLVLMNVAPSLADEKMDEDALRCIPTRNLTSTAVIDDRNVVFFMIGEPIYHNVLADNCIGLTKRGFFTYDVKLGNLCRGEKIVLAHVYFAPGRRCELGNFYRITREDLEALRSMSQGAPPPKPLSPAEVEDISAESGKTQGSEEN